uniref:Uncharacterized protein n=1 Tax=Spumella elongata TaxID=89044 RepID=A0A7S3LYQ8_9STRA
MEPPAESSARRRSWLGAGVLAAVSAALGASAAAGAAAPDLPKRRNLPVSEVAKIVREDVVQRQFLATADFSPEIYDDNCIFTDEIDSYTYEKFVKGTKGLFVASESNVKLVGDVEVLEGGSKLQFRFDEVLAVNLPIVHPKWTLSGTCTLTRGADGLIVAYKEKWDQSVPEVILSTRL